jgi:hypothetical protein
MPIGRASESREIACAIRSHYAKGFLKQYVRDHLCLRTELATNDVTDYGIRKAVENLPPLRVNSGRTRTRLVRDGGLQLSRIF